MQSDKSRIIIALSKIILRQKKNPTEKVVRSQNVAPGSVVLLSSINTQSVVSFVTAVDIMYYYYYDSAIRPLMPVFLGLSLLSSFLPELLIYHPVWQRHPTVLPA